MHVKKRNWTKFECKKCLFIKSDDLKITCAVSSPEVEVRVAIHFRNNLPGLAQLTKVTD